MTNPTPQTLIRMSDLCEWLQVSDFWVKDRMGSDPKFPVTDLARGTKQRRTLRFDAQSIANHFGFQLRLDPATGRPAQLLTVQQLLTWLNVSTEWLSERTAETNLPVIDLTKAGAEKRTLRFDAVAIAEHLDIPLHTEPAAA